MDTEQQLKNEADQCAHTIIGCTEDDGIVNCSHWSNCKCKAIARGFIVGYKTSLFDKKQVEADAFQRGFNAGLRENTDPRYRNNLK